MEFHNVKTRTYKIKMVGKNRNVLSPHSSIVPAPALILATTTDHSPRFKAARLASCKKKRKEKKQIAYQLPSPVRETGQTNTTHRSSQVHLAECSTTTGLSGCCRRSSGPRSGRRRPTRSRHGRLAPAPAPAPSTCTHSRAGFRRQRGLVRTRDRRLRPGCRGSPACRRGSGRSVRGCCCGWSWYGSSGGRRAGRGCRRGRWFRRDGLKVVVRRPALVVTPFSLH
jgi:hypothetical protein